VLNLIVIAPLLGLNAIFFFVGLYLSLRRDLDLLPDIDEDPWKDGPCLIS